MQFGNLDGLVNGTDNVVFDYETYNADIYTKCLLHFDGADAATTTPEVTGKVVTFVANAQLDTAQKKFGASSMLFDGTTDSIYLDDSADWVFGSGDFTIDFWVRFNSVSSVQGFYSQWNTAQLACIWYWDNTDGLMHVGISADLSTINGYTAAWSPSTNTWYHLAFVRNGNSGRIYVDGTAIGSAWDMTGLS